MATMATRQGKLLDQRKRKPTHLTPTGLLMEGDFTNNPDLAARIAKLDKSLIGLN